MWARTLSRSEGEMRVWASGPPLSEGEMSQSVGLRPPLSDTVMTGGPPLSDSEITLGYGEMYVKSYVCKKS